MKKVICNKHTLELARKQTGLAYKNCYLTLQHCLLDFFNRATGQEKENIKKTIQEVGKTYLQNKSYGEQNK